MILTVFFSVVAGALLWLDRVFVFQFLVSRPIVLSPILGLIMGNVSVGLIVGASLELLWLNAPPVGAYLPEDESFCAAAATPAAACAAIYMSDAAAAGLALLISLPFAMIGRVLDARIRTMNQDLIDQPSAEQIERAIGQAMGRALLRSYLYVLAALGISAALLCTAAVLIAGVLPDVVKTSLSYMPLAGIAIGLAGLVTKDIPKPGQVCLFILGMILILMISWIL